MTEDDFVHVLALNAKVENYAENIRQRLSSRPLFNPMDAFDALNKLNDVSITKDDFGQMLADHGFYATEGEVNTLVDRFDKNKDGRVSYHEFMKEITPHSPPRY